MQARTAHRLDSAVDPNQRPLVVLEVEHQRLAGERAGADDHLEIPVLETHLPHRNLFDREAAERIEDDVAARQEQPREDSPLEQEAPPWRRTGKPIAILRSAGAALRRFGGSGIRAPQGAFACRRSARFSQP